MARISAPLASPLASRCNAVQVGEQARACSPDLRYGFQSALADMKLTLFINSVLLPVVRETVRTVPVGLTPIISFEANKTSADELSDEAAIGDPPVSSLPVGPRFVILPVAALMLTGVGA